MNMGKEHSERIHGYKSSQRLFTVTKNFLHLEMRKYCEKLGMISTILVLRTKKEPRNPRVYLAFGAYYYSHSTSGKLIIVFSLVLS